MRSTNSFLTNRDWISASPLVARKRTMASIALRKMPMNFSLIYQFESIPHLR